MAEAPHTTPSGWSTKRYIVAALAGTLAATTVVIVVSAVLSPAAIYFSVTGASNKISSEGIKELNLTLNVSNPGHRAGVQYRSVIVYLQYTRAGIDYKTPANIDRSALLSYYQPPGSTASVKVSASLLNGGAGDGKPIGVEVLAVVRFKVGLAYTRPYNVKVVCTPVDYFSERPPCMPICCK